MSNYDKAKSILIDLLDNEQDNIDVLTLCDCIEVILDNEILDTDTSSMRQFLNDFRKEG